MIEVKGVWFWYEEGKPVLKNISLSFDEGILAVVGPNGSGKTTLVKMFNGLIKPKKGDVLVDGINTKEASTAQLSRIVGYVFQNPDAMFFEETVFDEVAFGPRNLGLSEEEVKERVKWALEAVGLKGFEDKNPFKLSGGEKQRLAIACILAMNPKYLVLDEPTTGLDERGVGALKNIIEELRKEGKSFVIVTHDMDLVLEVADKVLLLSNGEVQFYGDVFEFFELDLKRYKLEEPELVKICRGIGLKPVRSVEELLRGIGL